MSAILATMLFLAVPIPAVCDTQFASYEIHFDWKFEPCMFVSDSCQYRAVCAALTMTPQIWEKR